MVKTIAKLTLLTVLASLFALSQVQTAQGSLVPCTLEDGQCVSHGCNGLGSCVLTGGTCKCID
jgi:hypothetical protein